uniref:Uncharacterized protein n=1 Tax=Vespula pensylvanica TaxID=30213 RepID=A0A834UBY7_VESPE|nr:hypothetical protein H0235_005785 [Vespula pensylvanica]
MSLKKALCHKYNGKGFETWLKLKCDARKASPRTNIGVVSLILAKYSEISNGSAVTIGSRVWMVSLIHEDDVSAKRVGKRERENERVRRGKTRGDVFWRLRRDGRRVESRRPSDETPRRLVFAWETRRRLRLRVASTKFSANSCQSL